MISVSNNPKNKHILLLYNFILRHWPYLVMLAVPIAVLGPLYARGYILNYDMIFSPFYNINFENMQNGIGLYQPLILNLVLQILSFLLPMDIVQKLLLTAILFLCTFSIYKSIPITSRSARLAAGLMYTINPFVYDRLMAGHWRFLLAYSITPFILKAIYNLFQNPNRKNLLIVAGLWSLAIFINAHHAIIIGLLFVCLALFFIKKLKTLYYALSCIALVILANIWWLLPAILVPNSTNSFNLDHFFAFATNADANYGLWFNMLSLHGFWYKGWDGIKDYYLLWPLIFIAWLIPVYWGLGRFTTYPTKTRKLILSLLIASFIAVIYSAGPAPPVGGLNGWLFENVPGLSGMRESQKMLAILTLTYSVLAGYGFDYLFKIKRKLRAVVIIAPFAISALMVFVPMFWGLGGQLQTYNYPASWYQFKEILDSDKSSNQAVLLPWEIYVKDTITGKVIANPARNFFADKLVVSHRMLLPSIKDIETDQEHAITVALQKKDAKMLINATINTGAHYIVITESYADGQYSWLEKDPDIHRIINNPKLLVYRIDN